MNRGTLQPQSLYDVSIRSAAKQNCNSATDIRITYNGSIRLFTRHITVISHSQLQCETERVKVFYVPLETE